MAEHNNRPVLFTRFRRRPNEEARSNFRIVLLNVDLNTELEEKFVTTRTSTKRFEDRDECIDYITSRCEESSVYLITSENTGTCVIPLIHQIPQIKSIYVLVQGPAAQTHSLTSVCKRLGTFENPRVLRGQVMRDTCMTVEQPTTNARIEPAKFVAYRFFTNILLRLKPTNVGKSSMLNYFRSHYSQNTSTLKVVEEFARDYTAEKAIHWYTRDSFLFRLLNKSLRAQDVNLMVKFHPIINHLHHQLKELSNNQQHYHQDYTSRKSIFYRAQLMSSHELELITRNIGGLISFKSFLSTSKDREVALYLISLAYDESRQSVFFEIEVDLSCCKSACFADISANSAFSEECEVLFSTGTTFRIQSVRLPDKHDQHHSIALTLIDEDDEQFKELTYEWNASIGEQQILRETRGKELYVRHFKIEDAHLRQFQVMVDMLLRLDHTSEGMREMIEVCRMRYEGDQHIRADIDRLERTYRSDGALEWYTYNGFLHKFLNESLRMENIDFIFRLRYFIYDLHNQLSELYHKARSASNTQTPLILYRGQIMPISDLDDFKKNINCLVSMNSFLSTTSNRTAALFFSGEGTTPDAAHVSVLYEIEIDTTVESTTPYAKIAYRSIFADEDEVLFSVASVFRIGLVEEIGKHLWQVKLTLTNNDDKYWKAFTAHLN